MLHFITRVVCQIFLTIVWVLVYAFTICSDAKCDPKCQVYTKKERLFWTIYDVISYAFLTLFIWGVKFTINGVIG